MDDEMISNGISKELKKLNETITKNTMTQLVIPLLQGLIAIIVLLFAHYLFTCSGANCITYSYHN